MDTQTLQPYVICKPMAHIDPYSCSIKNNPGSSKSINSSAATVVVAAQTVEIHGCSVSKES